MKKLITTALGVALCIAMTTPTFAYNYTFGSGADSSSVFGNPTSYDEPANGDPLSSNERRNKDAALFAPPYGIFSGDIPTDASSPYHSNAPLNPWNGGVVITDGAVAANIPDFGTASPTFDIPTTNGGSSSLNGSTAETPSGLLTSTSVTAAYNITPWFYEDGSIGSIYIPKLNKSIKVYDGESLENMQKGIGRFTSTSAWDGNVGLAAHNRGASAYFSFVKDLEIGDTITYTTLYGERTYKITSKEQVSETDTSALRWTEDNTLTLITCVQNISELRWAVVCKEVR